jgi:hypothetical protein
VAIGTFAEVREGRVVAAAEAFAICVAIGWCDRGMAELPPLLHVWWIVPVEVIATGFKAIVEALALNIPEFLWRRIPAAVFMLRGRAVLDHWHRMSLHSFAEVREGRVVAAAEAFAVCVAVGWRNLGMPELPPPLHVWWIVTVEVVPGSFEAIVESPALNIPEFLGGRIPPATIMVGWGPILGYEQGRRSQ